MAKSFKDMNKRAQGEIMEPKGSGAREKTPAKATPKAKTTNTTPAKRGKAPARKQREKRDVRLYTLTTQTIFDQLTDAADRRGVSVNSLVNIFLTEGLERM